RRGGPLRDELSVRRPPVVDEESDVVEALAGQVRDRVRRPRWVPVQLDLLARAPVLEEDPDPGATLRRLPPPHLPEPEEARVELQGPLEVRHPDPEVRQLHRPGDARSDR